MKYRIIYMVEDNFTVIEFDADTPEEAITAAAENGFDFRSFNTNRAQREQLIGQPKFHGLLGPMWDGDALRYEDQATYREISQ